MGELAPDTLLFVGGSVCAVCLFAAALVWTASLGTVAGAATALASVFVAFGVLLFGLFAAGAAVVWYRQNE